MERLRQMSTEALQQYSDETFGGGEPDYPQWAQDLIGLLDQVEAIGAGGISAQPAASAESIATVSVRRVNPYVGKQMSLVTYNADTLELGDHNLYAAPPKDDKSDWCRISGCSHKNAGSPAWEKSPVRLTVPNHLIERLHKHLNDKANTAFARSTMSEVLQYLTREQS